MGRNASDSVRAEKTRKRLSSPRGRLESTCARYVGEALERRVQLSAHVVGSATVYPTIQAAVDAAAPLSVITVDSGAYSELVAVGKSLTIRGAQAGVDPRSNARQAAVNESVVNGSAGASGQSSSFYITASDVTIDGFTVQGNTSPTAYGAGIVIAPGRSGTHVLNNIIQNNISGLYLANASATDPAVIQHNVFAANNNAGDNGGRGIYTDGGVSGGTLTNVTIDSNFFIHNRGTSGVEAAIALQAGSSVQSDIRITNNTMEGNGKALLVYNASNLTIQGNTITDSADVDSGTLRFEGGVSNVVIESNNIYNNPSPAVRIDSKVVAAASSGFLLNYNNIYGNGYVDLANPPAGIQPGSVIVAAGTYSGALNAQNNWWGAAGGPGGDGAGSGDVLRANGASVTYSPFNTTAVVAQQSPFTDVAQVPDDQIQAVTFDQGGSNIGYLVAGSVNAAMPYRATAVTTETTADPGGAYDAPYDVAAMKAGQWLAYSVRVPLSGTYRLDFRVASPTSGGTFHATLDGTTVGGTQTVPNTGGSQVWQTRSGSNFSVTAGAHALQVHFDSNGTGTSAASIHWLKLVTVSTPAVVPSAPTTVVAIPVSTSQMDVTWSNTAVNQTGFTLERSINGTTFSTLATLTATTTAYADPGLAPNKSYFYRVKATNATGASSASNVVLGVTPLPPSVTQLGDVNWVSATTGFGTIQKDKSIAGTPITLRGTVYPRGIGTHALSQIVYNLGGAYSAFMSDVGVDDEEIGKGGTITFQVLGDNNAVLFPATAILTPTSAVVHININVVGVQQMTLVVGDGGDGNSFDHADWAGATLTGGAPAAPANLVASAAPLQVILNWTASPGAATYSVYRGTTAGGESATPIATGVTSAGYTDSAVTAGTSYYYQVAAVNAGGAGARSSEASAAPTAAQPPAAPTGVQAFQGIRQVSLTWPPVPGAASYKVYRGTTPGGEAATAYGSNLSTPGFTDSAAGVGATYYYKVTAVNAYGESARSGEAVGNALQTPAHIVIVIEENKDTAQVIGSALAPYINALAQQGAYFPNYFAATHPSQPNYLALFSGSTQGLTDDNPPNKQFTTPNLASQLVAAGFTFTGYSEDLPAVGSLADTGGPINSTGDPEYARKHNPWSDFSNVASTSNQPFTAFPSNYSLLPTLSFVVPNLDHDMHDGTVQTGDAWLQANIGAYATWAQTHNSLLVVAWDEDDSGDNINRVPAFITGQQIRPGNYTETTGHYGLLRTLEDIYGVTPLGAAATAASLQDVWAATAQPPAAPTGLVATPASGQITLDWQEIAGAADYSVYRGAAPGGEGASALATGLSTPHYVDGSVVPGTSYYYQVTATNSVGEGARGSELATATLKAAPVFSGLTASSLQAYGTSSISLGGTLAAGSFIPSGSVTITINGGSTGATINVATGAFTANFDTHLLPASATPYAVTYNFPGNSSFNAASDTSRTLTINPRALNVTATGTSRTYDGTTSATVALRDDRVNNDVLTLGYTSALFADKSVGTGKSINVTGIALSGGAASNYALANTSGTTTANVAKRTLTVSATGSNKVYDGTTSATVNLSDDRIAGDVLADSSASAVFASKTAGVGKTIAVTGIAIAGADAGNYSLANTTASAAADITALSVAGSVTASDKVYDGATAASLLTRSLIGVLGGDVVSLTGGTAAFLTKNVGTGITVTATGLSLSGTDSADYALISTSATTTANVTAAPLTGSVTAANKVYDATTAATLTNRSLNGVVTGDTVSLTGGSALFDTRNVGNGKTVTVTELALGGADAGNYALANPTETTTADTTPAAVIPSVTASSKTYDASTAATISGRSLTGVLGSDAVTLTGGSAGFDDKNIGFGETVTVTSLTLGGADAGNYSLSSTTASATADITAASVTGSVTAADKVYDATTVATLLSRNLAGVFDGDVVGLAGGAAAFDTRNVGNGKTVTATGLTLAGADAGNYVLSNPTEATTANLTPLTVSGSVTVSNKVYDATTSASIASRSLTGALPNDAVSLTGGTAAFDTKNVGNGKTVTATGLGLSGADAGNYSLSDTGGTATADVSPLPISGSVTASDKPYDATTTATLSSRNLTGVLGFDAVSMTGSDASFDTKNVGSGKTVTATGLGLSGADSGNYSLSNLTETTTASITPQLVIDGTANADDLRLALDPNPLFVDWFVFANGNPIQFGQLALADPSGLTINGNGGTDALLLDPANGNPLPNMLHLNGTFMISGLSAANPPALANTTLEIGNSTLYFAYSSGQSPAALIRQALAQGYNHGAWTGSPTASTGAVTSSGAAAGAASVFGVGYADSADGIVVGQPANTVEVRYTFMGDANLDRTVNMTDALRLQANYNSTNFPSWTQGNFNFDGAIDSVDAILLARNYTLTATGAPAAQPAAAPGLSSGSASSISSSAATGGLTPVVTATSPAKTTTPTTPTTTTSVTSSPPASPVVTASAVVPPSSTVTSHPNKLPTVTVDVSVKGSGKEDEKSGRRKDQRRRFGR